MKTKKERKATQSVFANGSLPCLQRFSALENKKSLLGQICFCALIFVLAIAQVFAFSQVSSKNSGISYGASQIFSISQNSVAPQVFDAVFFENFSAQSGSFCYGSTLAESQTNQPVVYIVVSNTAQLYERPSLSSKKVGLPLKHKAEIELVNSEKVAGENGSEGFWFFKVQQEGGLDAYVLCDLVAPKMQTLLTIPNYNAKTNTACTLFEIVVDNATEENSVKYQETTITLQKGTRIFLYQGYNRKSKFTAVALLRENEIVYGFLQTQTISPDGINPLIITCITLILAALGIIFAWMFMKHHKNVKLGKKYDIKTQK